MDWDEFVDMLPEPHTVTIEAYAGESGFGKSYAAAVTLDRCFVDTATRKRVQVQTQDAAGAEAVSSTQVYCPPGTIAPPDSRVTLPSGVTAKVLVAAELDDAGLDLPAHVLLSLE